MRPAVAFALAFVTMVATSCSKPPDPAAAPAPPSPPAGPSPVKVFSETKYVVETKGRLFGSTVEEKRVVRTGTGFLVEAEGRTLLVTAAHVASGPVHPAAIAEGGMETAIDGDRVRVTESTFRVRVGDLSLPPSRVLVDREADVALLSMDDEALGLLGLGGFDLARASPEAGDEVAVWGFPGTTVPQLKRGMLVSAIERFYFALNSPLEEGFSGGPVVGAGDRLLGVILRSGDRQTRCAPVAPVISLAARFAKASEPYSDDMPVR
ncbi:MAG: S1 family peptidase [Planctomycetota bacterium]|jgi:S1-C subfamily serine protease